MDSFFKRAFHATKPISPWNGDWEYRITQKPVAISPEMEEQGDDAPVEQLEITSPFATTGNKLPSDHSTVISSIINPTATLKSILKTESVREVAKYVKFTTSSTLIYDRELAPCPAQEDETNPWEVVSSAAITDEAVIQDDSNVATTVCLNGDAASSMDSLADTSRTIVVGDSLDSDDDTGANGAEVVKEGSSEDDTLTPVTPTSTDANAETDTPDPSLAEWLNFLGLRKFR